MKIKALIGTIIIIFLLILTGLFRTMDREIEIIKIEVEDIKNRIEIIKVPTIPFYLEDYFNELSKHYGVDVNLAGGIVECESDWNEFADNPISTAKGYFQFINSTWYETLEKMGIEQYHNQFNGELNLEAGFYLLSTIGTQPWEASKHCWKKYEFQKEY